MWEKSTKEEFVRRANIVHDNKYGYNKVVYINNATPVVITCPVHGDFEQRPNSHLRGYGCGACGNDSRRKSNTGKPKKRTKLICGVGINDYKGTIKHDGVHIQSYITWHGMLQRCYKEGELARRPSYEDCYVCEEWKLFSNFKRWFDDPNNGYMEGYQLDKDIIVKGNKLYSPSTCCFVPQEINTLFIKSNATRGDTPVGVSKKTGVNGIKYIAGLNTVEKRGYLGAFDTPEEAFNAYKQAKEKHIQEVALEYYSQGKITERVYNALINYKVEITD